ncbi:unnamed protein product [Aureobasidium uvarum]|uniref:Uncharacterized protein n=1 Tax=Aureobasidium uvarum TaxID=2773716 RepID=A0A9N8PMN0_9PEZI|nr:unnamed protein product [Aureobasidium uvarum]
MRSAGAGCGCPDSSSNGRPKLGQDEEIKDKKPEQKIKGEEAEPEAQATPALVVGSSSASQSSPAPSTPSSASSFSVKGASFAEIDAHQQTIQQTRAALTPTQRAALNLKEYSHYDLAGNKIGTLWQTRAEQRTFRQTQRRRGAKTVRAGTTNGMKLNRRC